MIQCQTILTFFFGVNETTACCLLEEVMTINMPNGCSLSGSETKFRYGLLLSLERHLAFRDGGRLPLASFCGEMGVSVGAQTQRVRGGNVGRAEMGVLVGRPPRGWRLPGPALAQGQGKS